MYIYIYIYIYVQVPPWDVATQSGIRPGARPLAERLDRAAQELDAGRVVAMTFYPQILQFHR